MTGIRANLTDVVALIEDVRRLFERGTLPPVIRVSLGEETVWYDDFDELRTDTALPNEIATLSVSLRAPDTLAGSADFLLSFEGRLGGGAMISADSDVKCVMVEALVERFAARTRVWHWWVTSSKHLLVAGGLSVLFLACTLTWGYAHGDLLSWRQASFAVVVTIPLSFGYYALVKPGQCVVVLRRSESWWQRHREDVSTVSFIVAAIGAVATAVLTIVNHR